MHDLYEHQDLTQTHNEHTEKKNLETSMIKIKVDIYLVVQVNVRKHKTYGGL